MAITRSMTVPISEKKQKYLLKLKALVVAAQDTATLATSTQKREALIRLFEFLNTAGFRVFGFSGADGRFTKATLTKVDSLSADLNAEVADGAVSKRVLILDIKLLKLLKTCKKMVIEHRTGILMALDTHFPQDIVREIAENYV